MRVLLLGANGNLGLRLVPALIAHGHQVVAFVRNVSKLRSLISATLFEKIETYQGDALDTQSVEDAIRVRRIDGVMNTAGTRLPADQEQELSKIATSVASAAIRVGKDRKKPLRAWLIGGMGSLKYPGSDQWQIQDYMPLRMTQHHKETEAVMKTIPTAEAPRNQKLLTAKGTPPAWRYSWFKYVPFMGSYLDIFLNITSYTTMLEDVANLIAQDFEAGSESEFIGALVGVKDSEKSKAS